jgi:hypothetical protein
VCVNQCAIDALTSSKHIGEVDGGVTRNMPVWTLKCLPALCAMLLLPTVTFCTDASIPTELSVRKVSAERQYIAGSIWSRIRDIPDLNLGGNTAHPDCGLSYVFLVSSGDCH